MKTIYEQLIELSYKAKRRFIAEYDVMDKLSVLSIQNMIKWSTKKDKTLRCGTCGGRLEEK